MSINEYILNISNDSKIVKEIARIVKNSTGAPAEIMARIANDYNIKLPNNVAMEMHTTTDDVLYFIIPVAYSDSTEGIEESIIAAGGNKNSTMSTVSCLSTVFTFSSVTTVNSMSTEGTLACLSSESPEGIKDWVRKYNKKHDKGKAHLGG